MTNDIRHMQHALRLATRGLGHVAPNPSVGAVIVRNGHIIGTGITARGGRPHAETAALAMAGADAHGATLYVTLEPCSHQGKTGPCSQAVIDAGITRVVAACRDSNPQVAGKGFAMLRAAGIEVVEEMCEAEARRLNEGFFLVMEQSRPLVTVKIATSQDGCTIAKQGRWITGEAARTRGHLLRTSHDAILTGIGTVLADNPALTCRLPGREHDSPQRILLDSALRTPINAAILPAWIMTSEKAEKDKYEPLTRNGARIFLLPQVEDRLSLTQLLNILAKEGITRLMVEGGKTLTEAFIKAGLADRIYWFRAAEMIGQEHSRLNLPHPLIPAHKEQVGEDVLEIYDLT